MLCAILLVLAAAVVPAMMVWVMGAGVPCWLAGLVAGGVCVLAGRWLVPHLPCDPDGSPPGRVGRRVLLLLWVLIGGLAAYTITSLSVFMYDVGRSDHAFNPTIREIDDPEFAKPFFPKHNCFTCYIVGAHVASTGVENVYDRKYYRQAEVETPIHRQIGESLHVDGYQYPPPFLILPRLLLATGGGFYQLRAYWFALNVIALVGTVATLLLWVYGPVFNARRLVLPILLVSPVVLGTLQMQNAHLFMIIISLLSLPAFEKRWDRVGGALLGFAIVSKLFPVLLLLFLILQKRWRAVGWTGGWMIAYGIIALLLFGPQPFEAFVTYQMPRLASGEAFSFATTCIAPLVKNGSILGIAYKLEKPGLLSDAAGVARALMWAYTVMVAAVALVVGLRRYGRPADDHADNRWTGSRLSLAQIWLVLLILGQLRSPFLPWVYGNVPVLLLLMLLLPAGRAGAGRILKTALLIVAWAMLAVIVPLPFGPASSTIDLIHTLGALFVVLVCCASVVARGGHPERVT